MKVIAPGDIEIELGTLEAAPSIGIIDYSRRVTDDFGVTTVVPRRFARRMSVRLALPFEDVDALQRALADLRATPAQWVADEDFAWLNFEGFYKDFSIDLAVPPISYCTLTVEGLAETEAGTDSGTDPAPNGGASTLLLVQPVAIATGMLVSHNVPETDYPEWSIATSYPLGGRVIKAATHRIYESAVAGNVADDPAGTSGRWIDIGPTNRWAMFDQALGTVTTRNDGIALTINPGAVDSVALLDVIGSTVRVQATGYDETVAVGPGPITFLDLPGTGGNITVTVSGSGAVSVGTLLVGTLVTLGVTGESPTAGIDDFSRKDVDEFGEVTVVPRAWAKRMSARALIRTDALDDVANRIASVRAVPSLWIADDGTDSLTLYGFFKDFSIEVGENVSTLSLTVEGLSEATPLADSFEGSSIIEKTIWKRSATAPATPTGGSFDFTTQITTPPSGWSATIPAGSDPAYSATAIAFKTGMGGSADFGPWSAPVLTIANGADGAPGSPGAPGSAGAPGASNFTLANQANLTIVTPNSVLKTSGGTDSNGKARTVQGYKSASISGKVTDYAQGVGLSTDPGASNWFEGVEYGVGAFGDGHCWVVHNGSLDVDLGPFTEYGDTLTVSSDGATVRYFRNGALLHSEAVGAPDQTLYGTVMVYTAGGALTDISFSSGGGALLYTWYAYADAPDGTFNFTTGNPGSRVYQGIATGKTTATESTNPGDYAWSQYVGPPNFGLAAFDTNTVVAGTKLIKVAGGDTWNGSVHSTESYKDGASVSFVVDHSAAAFMVGLNTDPTTDASYLSIDYAIYLSGGSVEVYESGEGLGSFGSYSVGDIFAITYNGKEVAYSVRSASGAGFSIFRTVPAPAGLNLFFDSSMLNQGTIHGRILSFTAAGTAGEDGAPGAPGTAGAPGAPGAPGVTYYTWYAYADAPDGSFNFTTGSPGTRVYQGVATGKTTATESTDPADYVWSPYIGPPNFGLTALNSNAIVAANKLIKVAGGSSWNASIHSTESYKGGATVSFVVDTGPHSFMVGLNTDPTTDASYLSIDFAIYIAGTTLQVYESGGLSHSLFGFVALNDRFAVTYNGKNVTYSKNGVIFYTSAVVVPADLTLFLDTSLLTSGVQLGKILAFTAVGPAGVDGTPGSPGAPGAPGAPGTDALDLAAAPASLVIPTSAIGVVTAGALPKTVQMTARLGATDVTGGTSWPAAVVDSCVVTNLGAGAYRVDDITSDTAAFEVTATYSGRSTKRKVTLAKAKAGSDAQQARAISIGTPTGLWATAAGSALSLNLFPGTTITLSLSAGYTATSVGSTRVMARLMYRNVTDGGAWTQAGADIVGSYASSTGGEEPVMTPGSCGGSRTVTAPGSPKAYEFRVDWIADGAASLAMTGTAFQVSIT